MLSSKGREEQDGGLSWVSYSVQELHTGVNMTESDLQTIHAVVAFVQHLRELDDVRVQS